MCSLVEIKDGVRVADIKAHIIREVSKAGKLCNKIESIVLFGSCLEERCKETSDIDLAIIINENCSKIFRDKGYDAFRQKIYSIDEEQNYDFLHFKSLECIQNSIEPICREIAAKGKVIYSKSKDN